MILIHHGVDCSPGRAVVAYGWRKQRRIHLEDQPYCAACGYLPKVGTNDVHHIIPRHIAPHLALDLSNFITLCRKYDCHLRIGHFGNYRKYWNPEIQKVLDNGQVGRDIMLAEELFLNRYDIEIRKWDAINKNLRAA